MSIQDALKEADLLRNRWREEPSAVNAIKLAYRYASKMQRRQIRTWMKIVLTDKDSSD